VTPKERPRRNSGASLCHCYRSKRGAMRWILPHDGVPMVAQKPQRGEIEPGDAKESPAETQGPVFHREEGMQLVEHRARNGPRTVLALRPSRARPKQYHVTALGCCTARCPRASCRLRGQTRSSGDVGSNVRFALKRTWLGDLWVHALVYVGTALSVGTALGHTKRTARARAPSAPAKSRAASAQAQARSPSTAAQARAPSGRATARLASGQAQSR
jgi:hypothetical protein